MPTETTKVETTEFEDGSTIVETTMTESEFIPGEEIDAPLIETIAEEIAEEKSDAVAVAEIEAERDITIAAIAADVATAEIEAKQERELTWQEELAEIRTNMQELRQAMSLLSEIVNLLTPQPSTEAEAEPLVIVETENLTPQSTLELTSETRTEVSQENEGEKPEAVTVTLAVPERRKRRLI